MTQHNSHRTFGTGKNLNKTEASSKQALDVNKLTTEESIAQAAPFTLHRNPDKAMQEMMDTISALRHVYEQENEALSKADTKEFMNLFEKKIRIARRYEDGVNQMIARREEFKGVAPELKQKLYAEQEEFSSLSSANLKALESMRKSVERLSERIMNVARETMRKDSVNYGAGGKLTQKERALSLGLNESA